MVSGAGKTTYLRWVRRHNLHSVTLDRVIALLGSLATLATAITAWLAIGEMRRQRQSTYKPDLVVMPLFFRISAERRDSEISFRGLRNGPPDGAQADPSGQVSLHCVNTGLAAAKEVSWRWNLQLGEFIEALMLSGALPDHLIWNEADRLTVQNTATSKDQSFPHYLYDHGSFAFILPATPGTPPENIPIPPELFHLLGLWALAAQSPAEPGHAALNPIPRPIAEFLLRYRDVEDNEHLKRYQIYMDTYAYSPLGDSATQELFAQGRLFPIPAGA